MIIGITGLIGSGKDTAADYLCRFHGYRRMSFASTLKDAVSAVFGWDRELLEGSTKASREWREQKDEWWSKRLGIEIAPRWVLQHWGTEVLRRGFHQDIWVASVENKLRTLKENVVITDCRFINEINAIRESGGIVVRTHRGSDPEWLSLAAQYNHAENANLRELYKNQLENQFKIHASEYSSVGLTYDFYLDNNRTIDDLHNQIELIVNH